MSCPCDLPPIARDRDIAPGLHRLPRAIGDFAAFRRSMLAGIRTWPAMDDWRARDRDDLGVMLLEFWAYVSDIVAFYDEVHANEAYIRTAAGPDSLRRLIGLLGYQPRPATAASCMVAVQAEGPDALLLPPGVAFRSAGFGDEAPQVFELETSWEVHALANRWTVKPPRTSRLSAGAGDYTESYLDCAPRPLDLEPGDVTLVRKPGRVSGVHEVVTVEDVTAADGARTVRVTFDTPLSLPRSTVVERLEVLKPTQSTGLWVDAPIAGSNADIVLDRLQPGIRPGDRIVLSQGDDHRWFRVISSQTVDRTVRPQEVVSATVEGETVSILIPAVRARTTHLEFDVGVNNAARRGSRPSWTLSTDAPAITVHHGLVRAARVATRPIMQIQPDDPLDLVAGPRGLVAVPPEPDRTRRFMLQDESGRAYAVKGSLDADAGQFLFEESVVWPEPLVPPVTLYGNVVDTRRGERVVDEVLGSGDRSRAGQVFKLSKAPVTYVPDTSGITALGYRSTVTIWVDGIEWNEIENFVGAGPDDSIYVLRQNGDGETEVHFGDGEHGRRLPTGSSNVVATYRQGAGAAAPPARVLNQLARPVVGVSSVDNPLKAGGGSDSESPVDTRENGPSVALLLGRIVSVEDVRAVAATYPGVVAAQADWRWHNERQTAVIQIFCIAPGIDLNELRAKIRNLAEPSLQVDVAEAVAIPLRLSLSLKIDPRHRESDVLAEMRSRLMDAKTGSLSAANIGIGVPLFRSRIYASALATAGAVAVTELLADGAPFVDSGRAPGAGNWYDVAAGGLVLNGQVEAGDGE